MPLTYEQRRDLLRAERSHETAKIRAALQTILLDNKTATLLDCEMALRDAATRTYLVAYLLAGKSGLTICGSMPDAWALLHEAGISPDQNRDALRELKP